MQENNVEHYKCLSVKALFAGRYTEDIIEKRNTQSAAAWLENLKPTGVIFLKPKVAESEIFKALFLENR